MKIVLFITCLFHFLSGIAQYDIEAVKKDNSNPNSKIDWFNIKQHTYIGGEFGLSIGSSGSYIHIAPLIAYDITEEISVGVSVTYQLYRLKQSNSTLSFSTVGTGVFARYRPIEKVIFQLEGDMYNTVNFSNPSQRINVPAFMGGVGYANSLGKRTYYHILLLYDFINNPNMPLPSVILEPLHLKVGVNWHLG